MVSSEGTIAHSQEAYRTMSHIFVPVVDQERHPLMPTTPSRARTWIKSGKATQFWKGGLFCVRLNVEPSARVLQPVAVGIDPGSKREGYSVTGTSHTYTNIQAQARDGVQEAERRSTQRRRTRRGRNTPCRKPRQNRKQSKQQLPPSTRARWHWKLRLVTLLCQLFPVSVLVVEDIKAQTKPNKRRWNSSFSPLQVGKQWFYQELGKLAPVQTKQGYETKELREQWGLKKAGKKLAEVWEAHCVDAWVLASSAVGGEPKPDNTRLVCISPLSWHHRQLHRYEPEQGGKRKRYGGTFSQAIKRGTLVKHPKWGKAYVGGTMDGKLSLHDPQTGKRLTQSAKVADCRLIKVLRWKTRLVPLSTTKKGALASSPVSKARGIRKRRFL
jgi:hypothetical protein